MGIKDVLLKTLIEMKEKYEGYYFCKKDKVKGIYRDCIVELHVIGVDIDSDDMNLFLRREILSRGDECYEVTAAIYNKEGIGDSYKQGHVKIDDKTEYKIKEWVGGEKIL